ncbi:hypothetical protein WJX72_002487 [[Myrmecia] bisecta]|uniref:Uncharacterized protein n=1 Tax=[Myrmecia] bisecta TaxID=41462 RepID=A0AAW1QPI9_9CHLO
MGDNQHFCLTLRPSKEEFSRPFTDYVREVARNHPNLAMFKVVPPRGWSARTSQMPDLSELKINTPIKQHVFGTRGAYRCLFEEQKEVSVAEFKRIAYSPTHATPPKGHRKDDLLERAFWSAVTINPPLYGADTPVSFFDEKLEFGWNLRHLNCLLADYDVPDIPGVTTPMTYFGMWKSFFSWHVEDIDLHSINYLHFGAPKVWYSVSPKDRSKFEQMARSLFPELDRECPAFLRHKDILLSPKVLKTYHIDYVQAKQEVGEFIVLNAGAYHSGFNLGFNCAEAVNFATPEWLPAGKTATRCTCTALPDSVRLDMHMFNRGPRASKRLREAQEEESDSEDEEEGSSSDEDEKAAEAEEKEELLRIAGLSAEEEASSGSEGQPPAEKRRPGPKPGWKKRIAEAVAASKAALAVGQQSDQADSKDAPKGGPAVTPIRRRPRKPMKKQAPALPPSPEQPKPAAPAVDVLLAEGRPKRGAARLAVAMATAELLREESGEGSSDDEQPASKRGRKPKRESSDPGDTLPLAAKRKRSSRPDDGPAPQRYGVGALLPVWGIRRRRGQRDGVLPYNGLAASSLRDRDGGVTSDYRQSHSHGSDRRGVAGSRLVHRDWATANKGFQPRTLPSTEKMARKYEAQGDYDSAARVRETCVDSQRRVYEVEVAGQRPAYRPVGSDADPPAAAHKRARLAGDAADASASTSSGAQHQDTSRWPPHTLTNARPGQQWQVEGGGGPETNGIARSAIQWIRGIIGGQGPAAPGLSAHPMEDEAPSAIVGEDDRTGERFFSLVQRLPRPPKRGGMVVLRGLLEGDDGIYRPTEEVFEQPQSTLIQVQTQYVAPRGGQPAGFKLLTVPKRILAYMQLGE